MASAKAEIDGIRRIWADADLIYDASDDETLQARWEDMPNPFDEGFQASFDWFRAMSAQLDFEVYTGTEDQLADPTIEGYEGVGHVPGYRGLAYVVFPNFQLEKFGNRIPNFRFEVYRGAETVCGLYSAGHVEPWLADRDPRNPANRNVYAGPASNFTSWSPDLDTAIAGTGLLLDHTIPSDNVHGWSVNDDPQMAEPCDSEGAVTANSPNDFVVVMLHLNYIEYVGAHVCNLPYDGVAHSGDVFIATYGEGLIHWTGTYDPFGAVSHPACGSRDATAAR